MQPRSAGKLHVGGVIYRNGVFSVEMIFEPRQFFGADDEVKSAALAAKKLFYELLRLNGIPDHGEPEVLVKPTSGKAVAIYMACKASRKAASIILLDGK